MKQNSNKRVERVAAFGFRSLPPKPGSGGSEKIAIEFYPRLVERGYDVIAYNRIYKNEKTIDEYKGVKIINLKTVQTSGFDTFIHSMKASFHIIFNNTAEIVHIHNGGNSVWAIFLRLFGKKVFISQDGIDWERAKWSWYAKLFLRYSIYFTAKFPNRVIFDNIYVKDIFEKRFNKQFDFVPYGSETEVPVVKSNIMRKLNLEPNEYFLFVGRFIPDKGIHYLVAAFEQITTEKKLVLVGGSPNPSEYEDIIKKTNDKRIMFPGFIYGDDVTELMKNAYCYIQPSDIEGLSPVILTVMNLGTPLICSDIKENIYAVDDTASTFKSGDINSLREKLEFARDNQVSIREFAKKAKIRANAKFSWENFTNQYIKYFKEEQGESFNISLPFKLFNERIIKELYKKLIPPFNIRYKIYYHFIRPIFPVKFRRKFQSLVTFNIKYKTDFIDESFVKNIKGNSNLVEEISTLYPNYMQTAIILTHDLDDEEGLEQVSKIIDLEEKYGFKSCWFIVPYKYKVKGDVIKLIRDAGHEIGIHGFNHDGKLYSSKKVFDNRVPLINSAIEKYGAVGFRSPMVHRNIEWQQKLNIKYEASCFDYDPFQPFPNHTHMIWPFITGKFVELPYTIPQDHTLFHIFKRKDINIWRNKIQWLYENHGMVLALTHPEYFENNRITKHYEELLIFLNELKNAWRCLPKEIAELWMRREKSKTQNQHILQ